jgi:two-component system response regulator YesN
MTLSLEKDVTPPPLFSLAENTANYLLSQMANEVNFVKVSQKMATNRNKLSLAFKTYYGTTPLNWLKQQRMEYAAKLLIKTHQSILDIADAVGYQDSNHFSTTFKQQFLLSPLKYRHKYRDHNDLIVSE